MNIRKTGNNITAKVASVVFAVLLWFHVTTNATFNSKFSLPIQYAGPSEGFVVASTKPDKVTAVINGTGKELFVFYLKGLVRPDQSYALVILTGLSEGKNTITLDKNVMNLGLFSGLSVESILYPHNASFSIEIDREIKRTVAVNTVSLSGYRVREGYCVSGKPVAKPEFVVIQGPEEIINNFNSVKISSLSGKTVSLRDSVLKANLEKPQFVTVEPGEVEIYFFVEPLITRNLSGVSLIYEGFPEKNRPEFKPDSLSVSLKGPKSIVSGIEANSILAAIQYKRYLDHAAKGDSLITPTVTIPDGYEGIDVIDVIPKVVRFSVQSSI